MTTTFPGFRATLAIFGLVILAACGGGDESTIPFSTATEVKAAFLDSRPILPEVGKRVGPVSTGMMDPSEFEFQGTTSTGVPVVLTLRFIYRVQTASKVLVGGTLVPELQQIMAHIDGQDYLTPVLDIREYGGWLLIYASNRAYSMDWRVERWVMYHPETKQFVDCGEIDSIRPSSWGAAVSSLCVQH